MLPILILTFPTHRWHRQWHSQSRTSQVVQVLPLVDVSCPSDGFPHLHKPATLAIHRDVVEHPLALKSSRTAPRPRIDKKLTKLRWRLVDSRKKQPKSWNIIVTSTSILMNPPYYQGLYNFSPSFSWDRGGSFGLWFPWHTPWNVCSGYWRTSCLQPITTHHISHQITKHHITTNSKTNQPIILAPFVPFCPFFVLDFQQPGQPQTATEAASSLRVRSTDCSRSVKTCTAQSSALTAERSWSMRRSWFFGWFFRANWRGNIWNNYESKKPQATWVSKKTIHLEAIETVFLQKDKYLISTHQRNSIRAAPILALCITFCRKEPNKLETSGSRACKWQVPRGIFGRLPWNPGWLTLVHRKSWRFFAMIKLMSFDPAEVQFLHKKC